MRAKVCIPLEKRDEDTRKILDQGTEETCCGRRCFVVTVVGIFLFVTFVSLPAGAFLIIHGNRKNLMAFKVGGALVVSIPVVIGFIFCFILCLRRKHSRRLTFNSTAHF